MQIEKNLNKKIINEIWSFVPKNKKIVSHLMELLDLSRESIYRRLRGEVPFSIQEIATLSHTLNFSIDEIACGKSQNRIFFDQFGEISGDSYKSFLSMFDQFYSYLENMLPLDKKEIMLAINQFHPSLLISFEHLFKFIYYKWSHHVHTNPVSKEPFSRVVEATMDLKTLQKRVKNDLQKMDNIIVIFDSNIFINLIKDIDYYYRRKLIDSSGLGVLRREMSDLINCFEKIAETGFSPNNIKMNLYLSYFNINTNIGYLRFNNIQQSLFWLFSSTPIIMNNSGICEYQQKWLNFLRRQSICISQSNEILQTDYFEKQREYLNETLTGKNHMDPFFKNNA
jgi:hypothetical protein